MNGCGAQGSVLDPPDLRFRAACDEHDLAYAAGGTPKDREAADREFRREMLLKASCAPWYKAAYLYPAAWVYWGAVRVGGWRHWGACLLLGLVLGGCGLVEDGEPALAPKGRPEPLPCPRVWDEGKADSVWDCPDPRPPGAPTGRSAKP